MRSSLVLLTVLAFITALLAFKIKESSRPVSQIEQNRNTKRTIIRCSPDWNTVGKWLETSDIPPIPGAGNYKWKVSTQSDSAQFYFNQGINTYYSFHIIEAMASFKKAAKFDSTCGIIYWAQALTYGPNINDIGYAASPEALTANSKAAQFSASSSAKEKMMINAQMVRYSIDSTESREKLNQLYVDKMKATYEQFPNDADVAALYADALMLQHPWDLWSTDGTAKKWTPLIRSVLEKLLIRSPEHPGANHYYIHVMEASPYAAKAIPCAERLGRLTPGLSHTVHMPSHIYLRTGNYAKGVAVNEAAIKSYNNSISFYAPITDGSFLYLIHNLHMEVNSAMLAGRSTYTSAAAKNLVASIPVEYLQTPGAMGNTIQYVYGTPVLVDIRFGNWNNLLKNDKPSANESYSNVIYHLGRGMAFCARSDIAAARHELDELQLAMKDSALLIPLSPFSAAIDGAAIAQKLLSGTIAMKEKKFDVAIANFLVAVETEENMIYNEPRDWLLNPKHFLANAYIKAGKYDAAIKTLQKDLLNNSENGWALFGIWQALLGKKKSGEAAIMSKRFKKAFAQSDIKLVGPVFE